MHIKLKVSKSANQFFFISNLAEWHFSCRKEYNEKWTRKTGSLTPKETNALHRFKKVIGKYGFTYRKGKPQYLGRFFFQYTGDRIWKELKKFVTQNELQDIRNAFSVFKERFEKIWNSYKRSKRVKLLQDFLRQSHIKPLSEDLEVLFGSLKKYKEIGVCIIFSPNNSSKTAAGGANLDSPYISLELPELKVNTWQFAFSIGILAHEIAHLLFRESGGEKMLARIAREMKIPHKTKGISFNTTSILNEMIIESFAPLGYLGQKYFPRHLAQILLTNVDNGLKAMERFKHGKEVQYYNQLNQYFLWHLYPLATLYGKQKMRIDSTYVRQVAIILQELRRK